MKRLLLSILILSISYNLTRAQCSGCTITVNSSSNASYTLTATDVLCITGGTYTGTITAFPYGAKICVSGGAAFNPASMPTSSGTILINNGSSALLPAITTGTGFKVDNYGTVTFQGALTLSGISTLNNYAGCSMTIIQNFTLAQVGSSITNNGTINFSGTYIGNASTNVYNYGYFNISSTFTNSSSFKNYGKLSVTGDVTFATGAGSLFQNYCTLITDGNLTNNNTTSALSNYGFIIADATGKKITTAASTTWFQTADGVTKGVNFDNSGALTGKGNYYFTGTTRSLAGSIGADALGINFYDATPTGAQVLDVQTVAPNASVTKNSFTPPARTDLLSTCNISINKGPVAADDYYITSQNTNVFGNVFSNDIDPENNTLSLGATLIASPSHAGTFSLSSNGDFNYTPASGYYGTDVFIYSVCDNGTPSKCDTATVTITINQNPIPMPACDNPGTDPTVTLGTVPNTYYPGSANANAGASSLTLGAHMTGDAGSAIAAGDKLMIIQVQGGDISTNNNDSYGDGVLGGFGSGLLYNSNITAGTYEFVTATNSVPITGGTLNIASPLVYSYVNDAYVAGSHGQRKFQVIKVPQYANLQLTADIAIPAWNGATGGIFCISVANTLDMNGKTINGKGKGFRGGAGRTLAGAGGPYTDYVTLATVSHNAAKGEGIAGTPMYVNNAGVLLNTGSEGYPAGSMAQGAPGNAGGGGTDGSQPDNQMNTGGGGGANGGYGGKGGNAWSNAVPTGGEPGSPYMAACANRLVLGGGGGSGSTNNGTGDDCGGCTGGPFDGFASSGASGGGMVIIYADRINNTGTIDVSGYDANNTVLNDASGGGGAGGSVLLVSNNSLTGVKVLANGGAGGTNTGGGAPHGPGGGGGGGVIFSTSSVNYASTIKGGSSGLTAGPIPYGATNGSNGKIKATVKKSELPSGFLGCYNFVVAANDDNITSKNTAVSGNVLSNDFDVESNTVSFAGFYDPTTNAYINSGSLTVAGTALNGASVSNAGSLTIVNTGAYTFTPASGFVGTINLTYKITDNYSYQAIAYAKLKIQVLETCDNTNDIAPVNDNVVTYMNVPVSQNVLVNDIDPQNDTLVFNGFVNPSNSSNRLINGSINIGGKDRFGDNYTYAGSFAYGNDGSYTFTPVSHFTGSITIDYEVCDKNASQVCKKANLNISVEPVHTLSQNDYPYAGENAAFTYMNIPLNGPTLLRNAGDANAGDIISINTTPVTAPAHGTLTINSNGTYLYTPTNGYTGSDLFAYQICDNNASPACSRGVLYISVLESGAKITSQPAAQNVCNGDNATFAVTATGTNLAYQWQVSTDNGGTWNDVTNGGAYSGATSSSLSITPANSGMSNYQYRCALTTDCNTINTNAVLLLVGSSSITVTQQPGDNSVCNGSNASFTIGATGPSITYQWQESINNGVSWNDLSNSATYSGVTAATLQITGATNSMNNYRYRCQISSNCVASVYTSSSVLSVGSPAVNVINNPVSTAKCSSTNALFSVYATGASLTYQWQENKGSGWNNVTASSIYTNVTNDTLVLAGITSAMNSYQYRCVVSSGCASSANSGAATLTVNATPTIVNTTQGTRCGGGSETLTATASAGTINWYAYYIGGSPIATGTSYATPNISSNTNYYVDATNNGCRTLNRASVLAAVVSDVPSIISNPSDVTICEGSYQTFSIIGSSNVTGYQWQVSTDGGTSYSSIIDNALYSGAITNTLTIMGVDRSMTGYKYRCIASATCTPNATSTAATLTVNYPPVIVTSPVRAWVCAGSNASFSVTATGGVTGYQWQVSTDAGTTWTDITNTGVYTNATTSTLNITGATAGMNNYLYRCNVTGSCLPATTSASAPLVTNTNTITINTQPVATSACAATPTSLTVVASGPSLTYQWYKTSAPAGNVTNGGIFSGATTSVLGISDVTSITGNTYRCNISSTCATTVNSSAVAVTLNSTFPTITTNPSNATICEGANTSFSVVASVSAGTITYQWQTSADAGSTWNNTLNTGIYSGANATPLGLTSVPVSNSGYMYRCRIASTSNTICPSNTTNATLTVNPLPVTPTTAQTDRDNFCADDAGNINLSVTGGSGTTLRWFTGSCGGTAIGTGNPLTIASPATTTTYYARWETGCGNSSCASVTVTVKPLPIAPASVQTDYNNFCESDAGNINLTVTGGSGTLLKWFTGSCGGTLIGTGSPLTLPTPTVSTTYYAYYENSCGVSACSNILINVNPSPSAPTASASQTYCGSATISNLVATPPGGSTTNWYATPSGGSALAAGFVLSNGGTYYAESQNTLSTCVSNSRTPVEAVITATPPAPSGSAAQSFCTGNNPKVSDITLTGNNFTWYTASSGGSVVPGSTSIVSGTTYYASQTWNGCESTSRFGVTATINPTPAAPTGTASQSFCSATNPKVSDISATGSNIIWYDASSGGSVVAGTTALANGTTYYASQTTNGCESTSRLAVTVTVNTTPAAPTGSAAQSFCSAANPKVSDISVTGSNIIWYTAASGGSVVAGTTALVNGTTYYASQTTNGCESTSRLAVTVTVNTTPAAPTGSAAQLFCSAANPKVSDISVTGSNIIWYTASSGGSVVAGTTALTNGTTYYASQTIGGCESSSRLAVTVTVNTTPLAPTGTASQTFCSGANPTVSDIIISGSNVIWYDAAVGGNVVNNSTSLANGTTYYASQTVSGCESSSRLAVTVTVNTTPSAPTGTATQTFCSGTNPKVSDISVTGSNIIWYNAASGGSVVAGSTALANGTTYYASQTVSGCESSSRLAVAVTVNTTPSAPTGSAPQTFCSGANPKVSDISVTGSNIIWYNAASGGSLVAGTTALANGTTYYASQTVSGCESTSRLAVAVTVNTTPAAPTGTATQTFCSGANPKVSDISVTGSNIIWYNAASGGSVVAGTTALANGTTYYASQTLSGCESSSRLAVAVTVNTTPAAPTGSASQTFCSGANPKVSDISVTGSNIIWYNAASGGSVVAGTTTLVNGTTYYASQTVSGCESTSRLAVTVTVNTTPAAPTGSASQTFCSGANPKVSDISVTGSNIIWYNASSGGSIVAGTTALANGTTYYASQTVSGCESTSRLAVAVTVNTTPSAPTGTATQTFCSGTNPKVSDISVTGSNIIWYNAASGGSVVAGTTALANGTTYYASQTIGGCESTSRLAVTVTVNTTPLAPTGTATQTFCSGANPTVSNIVVSGSSIIWYDAAVGGNVVNNSTSLANGTTYYASQTVSGCESTSRLAVAVTVNTTPSAPTGIATQTFCSGTNPKVSDISVTGSNIIWYNAASGGSVVAGTTALVNGTTYYASQTVSSCESTSRLAVAVTVNTTPAAPTGSTSQTFCSGANPKVSDISVTGSNIIWYNAASGGSLVAGTTALANGTTYYASQTVSGCESTSRLAVAVTVNTTPAAPTGTATQTFCNGANPKVSDISVTGSNIIWYNAASGGSVVAGTTALANGTTYYASQTVSSCESTSRLAVAVTVNASPSAPAGLASQSFCSATNPKVSDISVTGSNIIWYNAASGGSVVAGTTALVNGTTYYASQTVSGCESTSRLAVAVTVNATPGAPTGAATQSFCSGANPTVSDIVVSGSNIIWYDAATGGNVVAGTTALVNATTYYASQTTNGCESTSRLAVTVTVHTTPSAPLSFPTQSFCSADNPKVSDISITGSNIIWYNAAVGGSTVAGSTALINNTTYYASQTSNGCESSSRQAVTVTVNTTPATPTGAAAQSFCSASTPRISDIVVTGSNIIWYDAASAGNVVAGTTALADGTTYHASQTVNGCESTSRLAVAITVHTTPAAPTGTATQSFCSADNPKISDISVTESNIIWYDAASGGNVMAGNTALADGTTYYGSQTTNGCESTSRFAVTVTVHTSPSAPTGTATQTFCSADNPKVSDISVTGSNIIWYDAATAGNIVAGNIALADGTTYYSSQTMNGCESATKLAVTVTVHTTPTAPTGNAIQNFCSSDNPKISNISVTGSNIIWYDAATAGNIVAGTNALVDGTTYYASQTTNGCESTSRLAVTVNVNTTPSAPTGSAAQSFCNGNSPKVSDIVVTGTNVIWYDAVSGGNVVAGNTALVNGTTYYASQTVNGCESTSRMAVIITILSCSGPNIINASVNIDENSANGTSVYNVNDNNTGNDKDVDGNNLTYSIISGNASGAFIIDPATGIITVADGTKLDYETTPTFILDVRASNGTITDDATITINLNNLNDNAPVAVADSYSVNEGGTLNIPAPGVLANDNDADGNSLTAIKVTVPLHGTLTLNADGSFTYTHDGSETTSDSFTYKANDGKFDSDTVIVNLTIIPVNNPPVVSTFSKTINEDNTLTFAASDFTGAYTDPENDPLAKIKITSLPLNGVLKLSDVPVNLLDEILATDLAKLTFEPDANWNGSTSFTWNASDGLLYALSDATVNITVNAVNDPPVLSDINTSVNEDNTLTFSALDFTGVYTDVENDPLVKIKITSLPLHGTLKLGGVPVTLNDEIPVASLGTLTFVPDPNWNGSTSFGWNGFDGTDYAVSPANVNITVNAVNDAPTVSDIYKGALTDATVTFTASDFTGAYADIENDPLAKIMIVNLPANGTLYLSGVPINAGDEISAANLGNITFVPSTGWNGTTSFAWNASDGSLYASSSASVSITISATPNNPPVVSDISKSVGQNNTLTFTAADFTGAYSDADSNPLVKIKITSLPANAKLQLSGVDVALNDEIPLASLGNLTLVPDANWSGTTSFGWNGFDGTVYANTGASVNVSVNSVNHPPVIAQSPLPVSLAEDSGSKTIDISGNVTDADGNPLTTSVTINPKHGTVSIDGSGNIIYTPDANFNGNDTITYQVCDNGTPPLCATGVVTVTVTPVNDPPILNNDTIKQNIVENSGPVTIDIPANTVNVDGDTLKTSVTIAPKHGTAKVDSTGKITYTPNTNFFGNDTITYQVCDNGTPSLCVTGTIIITVMHVNTPPVINTSPITQTMMEDGGSATIDVPGNTTNTDGDVLTTSVVTNPVHGTVSVDGTGKLIYTPNANFNGVDTITYQVCDNGTPSLCATGVAIVTVTPVNDPPMLTNDTIKQSILENGGPVTIDIPANTVNVDGDTLKTSITIAPKHGSATVDSTGKITYTPDANFSGNDTITYQVCDNGTPSLCVTGTIIITVTHVNTPPVINTSPITQTMMEDGGSATIDVPGNTTNADGDVLTTSVVTNPAHGTVSVDGTGKLIYTPNANFNGVDTITYQVCDNGTPSLCATGVAIVTVTPVNDPPMLINDTLKQSIVENSGPVAFDIPANTVNVDGDSLKTSIPVSPKHGTATVDNNGRIVYTPGANFTGTDTITYEVCDNGTPSLCATGTIIITVTAKPNNPPVVADISKTTVQDKPLTFSRADFISAFTDADNDTLVKIRFVTLPSNGTLKLNGVPVTVNQEISWADLNTLTFEAGTDYVSETTFAWEASDGKDYSSTSATVTIKITKPEVFVPEGFSPNGDGHNDQFVISGADKYIVTLRIYNRWGNLVYESKHYRNDWEGLANTGLLLDTKLPDGTYFYSINLNNGEKEKVGFITINR